jgi:hypothetical protein
LLVVGFAPIPSNEQLEEVYLRFSHYITLLAFFLVVRARRYLQVDADSLLAVDERAPILFLRSFDDDEKQQFASVQRALLDFSLETRLSNHFFRYGPFVAVGSPKERIPQIGAARVLLKDDEWQERVLAWIKESKLIIMYSGATHWVNWELRQVIENGRATSLILMFPEIKGWRPSRRRKNIEARVEKVREVFKDTLWADELAEFRDFAGLRAMLFRADGSMVMVKSRSRSRDAYHLAALIAHQQLLAGVKAPSDVDASGPASSARPSVLARGVMISAIVAMLAAALLTSIGDDTRSDDHEEETILAEDARLTFGQAEPPHGGDATEEAAQNMGEVKTEFQIQAAESKNMDWRQELKGRKLKYMKTGNGFSVQKSINLCSDGTFIYRDDDADISNDAMTGFNTSSKGGNSGQWQIQGDQFILQWNDGLRSQFTLSRRYVEEWEEWGTFVDDERWFNLRNKVCM